jgi:tungstate transport system substrate-binding protein
VAGERPLDIRGLPQATEAFRRLLEIEAPFLTLGVDPGLDVLLEGDPLLLNIISELPVNPAKVLGVRGEAAAAFIAWLLGEEAQQLIADFGVAEYGEPLFFPRAPGWSRTPTALMGRQPQGP